MGRDWCTYNDDRNQNEFCMFLLEKLRWSIEFSITLIYIMLCTLDRLGWHSLIVSHILSLNLLVWRKCVEDVLRSSGPPLNV